MGPHPAVADVRRAVRSVLADLGTRTALVACSGGADSTALAAALAFEAAGAGVRAGLVTVDHGLVTGSGDQAARVAQFGYDLGLDPVLSLRVEVGVRGGPEAAARTARYGALDATAAAWDAQVLLGHTLDDQAETVLLGLGRGSGARSVAGMAAVTGRYTRPFLSLRRRTAQDACVALGLDPWQDPQNADPAFQRVRLRREVLPLLEDVLQGGVAEALARTGSLVRDDLDALDAWSDDVLAAARRPDGTLDCGALAELPTAVRTRVLRAWAAHGAAPPLSAERTAALDVLVTGWRGQRAVQLPGGVTVHRRDGRLVAVTGV